MTERDDGETEAAADGHGGGGEDDPTTETGGRHPTDARDGDHFVYVLRCRDDTLYTGYTTDVERRVAEHDDGEGAKYTRGRAPVKLVHVEAFDSQSAAMAREYEVKQLVREEKESLISKSREPLD